MKKKILLTFLLVATLVAAMIWWTHRPDVSAPGNDGKTNSQQTGGEAFDKKQHATDDPASIWVVVNKQRPLSPKTYVPSDLMVPDVPMRANITSDEKQLRAEAARALESLTAAGKQQGLGFTLQSGYRSYSFQTSLYNRYVSQQGQATADTQSARPGYSEHQTGLAVDLGSAAHPECDVEACFGKTAEGEWLVKHAATYGFIIRYTSGNEHTTGYIAEPWHLRYVGAALAQELQHSDIATLETFFGLGEAPKYN
jgi:D-alanyl-D-alanine carboxypeptidase